MLNMGILFSASMADMGRLSGNLSCSLVSLFQDSFTKLYTCLLGIPTFQLPSHPTLLFLRTQLSGARVTLEIPPSLLPPGGLRLLVLLDLGPEGQARACHLVWRLSLKQRQDPMGNSSDRPPPHILCFGSSLKYLDNSAE